jgi:hypothetical protein
MSDDFDIFDILGSAEDDEPKSLNWAEDDVLTTASFPSTCLLREQKVQRGVRRPCNCSDAAKHRNFFDFCKAVVKPNLEKGQEVPSDIKVCWNGRNIFEGDLPRELIHKPTGARVKFDDLPYVRDVIYTLRKGTYWFQRAAFKGGDVKKGYSDLGRQLIILIAGKTSGEKLQTKAGKLLGDKVSKQGVKRLKNVLATIDGIIMQICLCYPGKEFLSWENMDSLIHCLIRNLVPDYIRPENRVDVETSYEKIKRIRKMIKESGFHISKDLQEIKVPRELTFFRKLLKPVASGKTPLDMYRVSVLCQTRASGAPPQTVYQKTLAKMKSVLRTPPSLEVYNQAAPYIKECIGEIHGQYCAGKSSEHLAHIWASLERTAKISLSDSAEVFHNHSGGGKLEAAREVLHSHPSIRQINLDDGTFTGVELTSENATPGERLFHWALGHFNITNPKATYDSNVMSVRISLVAEMGKFRGITVSHLAHAMALHPFSHVGLAYLRHIPSSESGIGAANHAWNFFKRMSKTNPSGQFLFGEEDVYLFSTDWETATDFMEHRVTADILNHFAVVLGLPTWYRRVIVLALTQPRQVEFISEEEKVLDRFFTGRGTLMGDPVTKVVLHLYHLVCRKAALRGSSIS